MSDNHSHEVTEPTDAWLIVVDYLFEEIDSLFSAIEKQLFVTPEQSGKIDSYMLVLDDLIEHVTRLKLNATIEG